MGSLLLNCPLCCTQTFKCRKSLKYHLLTIADNLICPVCKLTFTRITDLAMHLDIECAEKKFVQPPSAIKISEREKSEGKDDTFQGQFMEMIAKHPGDYTPNMKRARSANHSHNDVIVSEEHLSNGAGLESAQTEQEQQHSPPDSDENNSALTNTECYYCSTCEASFTQLTMHIQQFHPGQNVCVVEEIDNNNSPETKQDVIIVDEYTNNTVKENEDEDERQLHMRTNIQLTDSSVDNNENDDNQLQSPMEDTPSTITEQFHCEQQSIICDICNTQLASHKSLRLHKRMHERRPTNRNQSAQIDAIKPFACTLCNKTFDDECERVHFKLHHSNDSNRNDDDFTCRICNKKFHSKDNLEMHARGAHLQLREQESRPRPIEGARAATGAKYPCQYCGRGFGRPHEKVKHERIHTGERPHVCSVCGKAFRVSYCLTVHMRTHSGTRPYQCQLCGKRFKAHSGYRHHLLLHSETRNYQCPHCPKMFKTRVQLAGHRNSHTKPFPCTVCNRPFASLYAVRTHMETHKRAGNGLKCRCVTCGATYARAFALRDHILEHHGTTTNEAVVASDDCHLEMDDYQLIDDSSIVVAGETVVLADEVR